MKHKITGVSIISLFILLMTFCPNLIQPGEQNVRLKSQSELKTGMITHVDYDRKIIEFEDSQPLSR